LQHETCKKFGKKFGKKALALVACQAEDANVAGVSGKVTRVGTAEIGGPFTMIDETGASVSEADLLGKPHLIYFGFAFCPDICPTSLQKLGAAQQLMGKAGDDIGYILITVDPERDTPEKLFREAFGVSPGLWSRSTTRRPPIR